MTVKLKDAKKFGDVTRKVAAMAPNNQLVIWLDYHKGDSFKKRSLKIKPQVCICTKCESRD
ncbi:hypothetical protein BsIDN1_47900 [Bacillus safensis]|uniref:Uncharacterized protein n=1 Tax=Bacillus safensis TaxID=561879 RepID=A0A5S9MEX7_BACIA|nr:hypothetical protein BsIDN1_47900 [Bacillus safensis]